MFHMLLPVTISSGKTSTKTPLAAEGCSSGYKPVQTELPFLLCSETEVNPFSIHRNQMTFLQQYPQTPRKVLKQQHHHFARTERETREVAGRLCTNIQLFPSVTLAAGSTDTLPQTRKTSVSFFPSLFIYSKMQSHFRLWLQ